MSDEYVSKEVFSSEIRRIDERIDTILGRIDDKLDAHMSRIDARFARMDSRIDKIESRLEGIIMFIGWTIGITSIVIAVGTFIIQVMMK